MRKTTAETKHSSFLSNKLPAANFQHRKLTISFRRPMDGFSWKLSVFFLNLSRKLKVQ